LAANRPNLALYDVAASGRRILAVMSAEAVGEEPARHHVVFLRNFVDEIRRLVPTEN
jgi:hypothetical protein